MNELDMLLLRVSIDQVLATLPVADRELVLLCSGLEAPEDYQGPWPATLAAVGNYIGKKYDSGPLSEGAIRARRNKLFAGLQPKFGALHD
jgi:hypothetical protein